MFCGTGSFSHIEDEDDQLGGTSSPKNLKKKHANHNPYSNRGLDKFSAVLAELEARRDKIMAKAQDASMVRFMYNNSHDWVPIIIKLRENNNPSSLPKQQPQHHNHNHNHNQIQRECTRSEKLEKTLPPPPLENEEKKEVMMVMNKKKSFVCRRRRRTWVSGCYYWFLIMALIMVCLFLFGRVFAICCTSILWYLVPTLQARKPVKKKDYARKFTDIKKINKPQ